MLQSASPGDRRAIIFRTNASRNILTSGPTPIKQASFWKVGRIFSPSSLDVTALAATRCNVNSIWTSSNQ